MSGRRFVFQQSEAFGSICVVYAEKLVQEVQLNYGGRVAPSTILHMALRFPRFLMHLATNVVYQRAMSNYRIHIMLPVAK